RGFAASSRLRYRLFCPSTLLVHRHHSRSPHELALNGSEHATSASDVAQASPAPACARAIALLPTVRSRSRVLRTFTLHHLPTASDRFFGSARAMSLLSNPLRSLPARRQAVSTLLRLDLAVISNSNTRSISPRSDSGTVMTGWNAVEGCTEGGLTGVLTISTLVNITCIVIV
ncbi:hypothetical protein BMF94_0912, partial [Rhodotorula taiwanensis]